jgi:hypothetical protein
MILYLYKIEQFLFGKKWSWWPLGTPYQVLGFGDELFFIAMQKFPLQLSLK